VQAHPVLRRAFIVNGSAWLGAAFARGAERRSLVLAAAPLGHDIDPYRDVEDGVPELSWLYADGLVGWDRGLVPLLAESLPDVADGGRTYRYRLRAVRWHDGRPLRAADVVAAFDALRGTPWGLREPYRHVRSIEAGGAHELIVRLDAPHPPFARSFFGAAGTPALPVIRHDAAGQPIGTGPFAVRAHPDPARWLLERWDGSPRGESRVDRIDVRLLSAQITANVQLLSGEADVALPLPPNVMRADRFVQMRRPTTTAVLLINAERLLRTSALRQSFVAAANVPALQRAYDRKRRSLLASITLDGPDDAALRSALAFRPERAETLRTAVAGRDLVLAYVATPGPERTMTLLQQNLRQAGIGSELRPYPVSRYLGADGPLRTGAFDVAIYGLTYGADADLGPDWSCAARPPHGGNFARWCDPPFEQALLAGHGDRALRRLYDALVCIPLSHAYEDVGVSRRVRGFTPPGARVPMTYFCFRWSLVP
jgi:ABC-type transport system substrate-binding protein